MKLYNKQENLNFNKIRMPYESNTIPQKIFYAPISAEILQLCKETTKFQDFSIKIAKSAKLLIGRIIKKGV